MDKSMKEEAYLSESDEFGQNHKKVNFCTVIRVHDKHGDRVERMKPECTEKKHD